MRVSKRPYGGAGPLSTHTEVKPQAGTSLESIKSLPLFRWPVTF